MYACGQREMQEMDRYTMEKIGLPGVVLMENAGAKVVSEMKSFGLTKDSNVVILAGSGNNGGDGFVIARRLFDEGLEPDLYIFSPYKKLKGDAKVHFDVYKNRKLPFIEWQEGEKDRLAEKLQQADFIVDALLGTGVKGAVREPYKTIIEMVNNLNDKKTVIAVDVPSGVNSDTGKVDGVAIKADYTITFVFPKKGFFLQDGPTYVGKWKAVDISVPPSIAIERKMNLPKVITDEIGRESIPKRVPHGHKGTFGHTLVIGGSAPYVGAPIFTAKAAYYSGAGLVTLAIPTTIYSSVASQSPESLLLPLPDEDGHFSMEAIDEIASKVQSFTTIAIGPGISRFTDGEEWIGSLLSKLSPKPLVIDADGLFLIRNQLHRLKKYSGPVILTPHPGEMATLTGKTVQEIEENRFEVAKRFATEFELYLLLKGHRTVIATPDGKLYINPFGHDALGKGGSGDVLTGLIASFIAQGAEVLHAIIGACYIHAKSGERKGKHLSNYSVGPFDLIDGVKEQLNEFSKI